MTHELLSGVRVVDVTDPLGAYTTRLMADLGAQVERVELASEPVARSPFLCEGGPSLFSAFVNAGKRTLPVDAARLDESEIQSVLDELWASCDCLVWSSLDGINDKHWPSISRFTRDPSRVLTVITPFGTHGPYSSFVSSDLVTMALGGFLSLCGYPDKPVVPFGEQSFYAASLHAALGTAVALYHLRTRGTGQVVEVAAIAAVAHALENAVQFVDLENVVRERSGENDREAGTGIFACADGHVYLMSSLYGALLRWDELVEWLLDQNTQGADALRQPRWLDQDWRTTDEAKEEFRKIFEGFTLRHSKRQLFDQGQRRRINIAPLSTLRDLAEDPQLVARSFFSSSQNADLRQPMIVPGSPFRVRIAPRDAAMSRPIIARPRDCSEVDPTVLPLADVRIVDFTWMGVGPFATKFLADLGADVIKIESTEHLDTIRTMRPAANGETGINRSGYFANRNSSKRSITLDLKHDEGLKLARELLRTADVAINNFSPGVMERLRLSSDDALALNPTLIYVDMPMMGNYGPHHKVRGYGSMISAISGLYATTGIAGRRPCGTGTNYPDHVPNPLHTALCIVAALHARHRTGCGAVIEVSQLESTVNVMGPWLMAVLNGAGDPGLLGCTHIDYVPQGVFRGADDTWCALTVRTQAQWAELARSLGRDDWIELSAPERRDREHDIDAALTDWVGHQSGQEAALSLQGRGIPGGWVQDAADVLADPQLAALDHWVYLEHQEMGRCVYDGPVARLSKTPAQLRHAAPCLGEHTLEILTSMGIGRHRFHELATAGALGTIIQELVGNGGITDGVNA